MSLDFFLRETISQYREDDVLYSGLVSGLTGVSRQPASAALILVTTTSTAGGSVILQGSLAGASQNDTLSVDANGFKLSANEFDQISSVSTSGLDTSATITLQARTTGMQPLTQKYLITQFLGQISHPRSSLMTAIPGAQDLGSMVCYHKQTGIKSGDLLLRQGEWFVVRGAPLPITDFSGNVLFYKTFLERE
jgi:hypothetical protein